MSYLRNIDIKNAENGISSSYANGFGKIGKWPADIQIPKNADVLRPDGSINWDKAPQGGYVLKDDGTADKGEVVTPLKGKIIDRYGSPDGRYVSPINNNKPYPYEERSLPYIENPSSYHMYKVEGDLKKIQEYISNCTDMKLKAKIESYTKKYYNGDYSRLITYEGKIKDIKGWGLGGGVQYEFPLPIELLEKLGLLKEIQ